MEILRELTEIEKQAAKLIASVPPIAKAAAPNMVADANALLFKIGELRADVAANKN